jgi:hypothetical protein
MFFRIGAGGYMRLEIHYRIAKKISAEMKNRGVNLHEKSFLFGNFFPDLIHSYFWCKHEYHASRDFLKKKIERLKKQPIFFSFRLGVLTHYISDYFCYPHSSVYNGGMFQHIMYEARQKVPADLSGISLNIKSFAIEEVGKFVEWYERFRPLFKDDGHDFQLAALVSSGFLQAAYDWFCWEYLSDTAFMDNLPYWERQGPVYG